MTYLHLVSLSVLGAALLDAGRVMDLCLSRSLSPESFYVRSHQVIFEVLVEMLQASRASSVLRCFS